MEGVGVGWGEGRGEGRSLFVGCLTSQQHASVSQGRICSDNFTCCHTEIQVADQTFQLTQSHYTDTGPTSPSTDPITPGAWQGSHWSANFEVTSKKKKKSRHKRDSNPGSSALEADALTTRPTRWLGKGGLMPDVHSADMARTGTEAKVFRTQDWRLLLSTVCAVFV